MPNNIQHIPIPRNTWVDLYDLSGIAVGEQLIVENVGVCDIYLAVQAAQPDKDHDAYNILKRDDDIRLTNQAGDLGAWAFCNTSAGLIEVSIRDGFQPLLATTAHDGLGNPIGSLKGAINVHDADVHDVPINELLHRHTGIDTTIAVAASAGDTSITVVDGSLFADGSSFQIEEGAVIEATFPVINSGGGTNTFVLDRPLDNDFDIGAIVEAVDTNMAVDGTLLAPVSFRLIPDAEQEWHAITVTLSMTHSGGSDPSLFGDLTELLNGLVFRAFNGATGQHRTFDVWKNNAQIGLTFGKVEYEPKVGGGDFGTFATASIKLRSGAVPKLSGKNGDYIEGLVQDPLAALITVNIKVQGHIEGI
ncbi:MAG: hypothetical protein KAR42_15360 [candidate division Zixibacteria bacterium]|nr:hypothetical protein [candidate division Zixibacteria bacterium]